MLARKATRCCRGGSPPNRWVLTVTPAAEELGLYPAGNFGIVERVPGGLGQKWRFRLSKALGSTPETWMREGDLINLAVMHMAYDLWQA